MIPEVFNNKERHPKLSFLERDANLVLPFLTLGYGKKNIRERRGEGRGRGRGEGGEEVLRIVMWDGGRDRAVTLNIYTASDRDSSEDLLSHLSSSITRLQTNQLA